MPEISVDYMRVILKLVFSLVVIVATWIEYRIVREVINTEALSVPREFNAYTEALAKL